MDTLLVERVEPYTPGSDSASVTLRSTYGEIEVFCYPCTLKNGDSVVNHLTALDAEARAAYLSDWPMEEKKKKRKNVWKKQAHTLIRDAVEL